MNDYFKNLPAELKKKLKKIKMPSFEKPMLATLTKDYFSSKEWIFERKFDGVRCLIFKDGHIVHLKTRNDKSLNAMYPEIFDAAEQLAVDRVILDGEIVALKGGATSFELLQQRLGIQDREKALSRGIKIHMYIFDILYLDGYSLLHLPLLTRKMILKEVIDFTGPFRYVTHKTTQGEKFFKIACTKGWEGLIAKKSSGAYVHKRSRDWLKFKCVSNQELVIGGYTDPQRSRSGFGALLLGYYKGKKFMFAGKVGTGFSDEFLTDFVKKLQKIEIKKNPFSNEEMVTKNVHFVKPFYVAEIGFEEWTRDNKLRQGRFLGLRMDKSAKSVVKEEPAD